ncbi:MAG: type II secretion system F family protein [Spartobacteria bacterium]|nr:type II secretion system F family protein [Spartobacteria bacterium]
MIETLYEWLAIALLCGAVYLFVYSLIRAEAGSYLSVYMLYRTRRTGFKLVMTPILAQVTRLHQRLLGKDNHYVKSLENKLRRSGLISIYSADEMFSWQLLAATLAMLGVGLLLWLAPRQDNTNAATILALVLVSGVTAFVLPVLPISNVISRRQMAIMRDWPYFMDLLTLAMESGMDMTIAITRIISSSHLTPLMEELQIMMNEVRLGAQRTDALRNMARRIDTPSITSIINMMIQAEQLGTEIGPLLRAQAKEFRERRAARVEKIAMESSVKMMGPLLGCIFPAILLILLGPILIQYFQTR